MMYTLEEIESGWLISFIKKDLGGIEKRFFDNYVDALDYIKYLIQKGKANEKPVG